MKILKILNHEISIVKYQVESLVFKTFVLRPYLNRYGLNELKELDEVQASLAFLKHIVKYPVHMDGLFEKSYYDFRSWWEDSTEISIEDFRLKVRALLLLLEASLAESRFINR